MGRPRLVTVRPSGPRFSKIRRHFALNSVAVSVSGLVFMANPVSQIRTEMTSHFCWTIHHGPAANTLLMSPSTMHRHLGLGQSPLTLLNELVRRMRHNENDRRRTEMKSHTQSLWFSTKKKREFINITPEL